MIRFTKSNENIRKKKGAATWVAPKKGKRI